MDRNPASDLWKYTLSQIPTMFGRLHYLASLRDPNSGQYHHYGLAQRFDESIAGTTLRDNHLECFEEWLGFTVEKQKTDIERYLAGLEGDPKEILANWIQLGTLRNCVPVEIREVERTLYLSDLNALLEMLRYEYAVVLPDRDA